MFDQLKKILLHKNTGKVILVVGCIYTIANTLYQEESRKETWRQMIKEEVALQVKKEDKP